MKISLAKIEARLQALVEGSAERLFASNHPPANLAQRLIGAMQANLQPGPDGRLVAPNLYTLQVHPSQVQSLAENRALLEGLTQTLRETGIQAGVIFPAPPVVRVSGAFKIHPGEVQVVAQNSLANLPETSDMVVENLSEPEAIPSNAFLIVDGTQNVPLTQSVINIGRRKDNHIVIDDQRVSRVHAQMRAMKGRYVIFDLDSLGGTFINGEAIHHCPLAPGDVISLSGVPLVYGEDPIGLGETQDFIP
jgi:hypothetical protein